MIVQLYPFQAGLLLQMLIKHVTLAVQINAAGMGLHQEVIVIMLMVAPTLAALEQFVIGMLLIIFVKISQQAVELGD